MPPSAARTVPVKIFGLQRTGTNLMAALLARNFRAECLDRETEWKHGKVKDPRRRRGRFPARFVLCVRDPYAWLRGCFCYFQEANRYDPTIAPQFQLDPSQSFDEFVMSGSYEFPNPVTRWNRMNAHWLDALPAARTVVVRLEDQVLDQIRVLKKLKQSLHLPARRGGFHAIDPRVDVVPSGRGKFLNRDFATDREYMSAYSPALLEWVNRHLDATLLDRLSYRLETFTLAERTADGTTLTVRPLTHDASVARAVSADPYAFEEIRRWSGTAIRNVVDVGAHIGAAAIKAKQIWPACRVIAYEAWAENARLLRINARRGPGITPVHAAMTGGGQSTVNFRPPSSRAPCDTANGRVDDSGYDTVPAVGLEHALALLGDDIDVLKVGCPASLARILSGAADTGLLARVAWVCGQLPLESAQRNHVKRVLAATHFLQVRTTDAGDFFLARRATAPGANGHGSVTSGILTASTAYPAARRFIETIKRFPPARFRGRGIVICAGGPRYFPCAWVCINMLRHVGVTLPIEMWALHAGELDPHMRGLVEPLGVTCVDASVVRRRHPVRMLDGWELKPYAILHSRFKEVLFLDADNVPVKDATALFDSKQYVEHGAVFWPAYGYLRRNNPLWQVCRVPYRKESDFESGQIVVDKSRCWKPLQLAMHLNENSDFYYQHTQGDKETFHMAWRMLGQDYAMIPTPVERLDGAACQHDFDGRRIFQHRYEAKWSITDPNPMIPGFEMEDVCLRHVLFLYNELRHRADRSGDDKLRQVPIRVR